MSFNVQKPHLLKKEEKKVENFAFQLIVWNDDINSFDTVINTLVEVCKHTIEQAEQCTLLIHYTGKCTVKNGDIDILFPMYKEIGKRGITASIEAN